VCPETTHLQTKHNQASDPSDAGNENQTPQADTASHITVVRQKYGVGIVLESRLQRYMRCQAVEFSNRKGRVTQPVELSDWKEE
jgi:hypothetical protein